MQMDKLRNLETEPGDLVVAFFANTVASYGDRKVEMPNLSWKLCDRPHPVNIREYFPINKSSNKLLIEGTSILILSVR